MFITVNLVLLTVIKIVEHFKTKKIKLISKLLIIISFNLLMTLFLFPNALLYSLIIDFCIIIVIGIKYLLDKRLEKIIDKKDKNNGNGI
jgi:hypothetical protein